TRAELHTDRDAAELPVGELVSRPEVIAIVRLDAQSGGSPGLCQPLRLAQHAGPLLVVPEDRDDYHLDRRDAGRKPQPLLVPVGHDQPTDEPRGRTPRRRFGEMRLAVAT